MKLNENTINKLSKYAKAFDEVEDNEIRLRLECEMESFIFGVENATDCTIVPLWNDGHIVRIVVVDDGIVYSSDKYDVWK